jgi:MFS transporter, YNFM family, putative membrane transport protein
MAEVAGKVNHATTERNYPLMTAILFWSGLVVVSSLYITIPLVSVFADIFEVTSAQAAWTSSAFSFCYAIGFLFFGPLSDLYGSKLIILIGLGVLTIVTPIIGLFDNLSWLIALRGIQGVAAATFAPAALSYAVEMFPAEKRVTTIGFVSTGFLMAAIVGQVISSLVSQILSWNYVFYLLGVIYLITALLIALFIPIGEGQQERTTILTSFKQMREVFAQKSLLLCYVVTVTLLFSMVGMYSALGTYLSGPAFGLDGKSILYIRSAGIIGMLLSPFAGRLVTKFGIQNVLRGGLSLAVVGLAILGVSSNLFFLILMSVIFVAGISITVPTLISLVGQFGGTAKGVSVALYTFILFIGASLGPIAAVSLLKTGSYLLTFEVLALLLGIGLAISFLISNPKKE